MENSRIKTRQEAADYLGIGLSLLDQQIRRRAYPIPHIRVGRRVLIPSDELDRWIAEETERNVAS